MYKKFIIFPIGIAILGLSGCGGHKKVKSGSAYKVAHNDSSINMPLAQDEKNPKITFFDEDLGEFENSEPFVLDEESAQEISQDTQITLAADQDNDEVNKDSLVVYYEYDSTRIRPDQSAKIAQAKQQVQKWLDDGMKVVFKGHSCKWHGTADYNIALSKQRASSLAQVCVTDVVDQANIKTFGVGNEELIAFENSIEGQAPNRRVEIYAISA